MISTADLHSTAREYLRAAKLLRTRRSYDVAAYLCGYALRSHSKRVSAAHSTGRLDFQRRAPSLS